MRTTTMDLLGDYSDEPESKTPITTAAATADSTAAGTEPSRARQQERSTKDGAASHVTHAAPRLLESRVTSAPPISAASSSFSGGGGGVGHSAAIVAYGGGSRASSAIVPHEAATTPAVLALRQALEGGVMTTNLRADQLWGASAGPANPYAVKRIPTDKNHTVIGAMSMEAVDPSAFQAQFNSFNSRGVAMDPTGSGAWITNAVAPPVSTAPSRRKDGDSAAAAAPAPSYSWAQPIGVGASVGRMPAGMTVAVSKRMRDSAGDITSDPESYRGPWAGFEGEAATKVSTMARGELTDAQKKLRIEQGYHADRAGKLKDTVDAASGPVIGAAAAASRGSSASTAAKSGTAALILEGSRPEYAGGGSSAEVAAASAAASAASSSSATRRSAEIEALEVEAMRRLRGEDAGSEEDGGAAASAPALGITSSVIFHGKETHDYQGRCWVEPPKGVHPDDGDHECFVPKKPLHKWTGHNKGVQSIQFFPGTGHLLLSGSLDTKVKIWDVYEKGRPVKQTYLGHSGAVRQVNFNNDGSRFLSCSYDRHVRVWDTEVGKTVVDVTNGKVPYCGTWYPLDNNVFLVGNANKRIVQYDVRTGAVELEYNYHLGAVNTVTFVDEARRIVSTSDDKKVLVWEFNTPVPNKYIQDPSMHSIPAVAVHPDGESLVGQSMDNTLVVYYTGDRIGLNRKKQFKSHITAGFACQPCFSPDGRYVASGDGVGSLWFWEWKSGKMFRKIANAHDNGPSICMAWHPLEPSWVATCGWDGLIKLWN